MTSVSYSSVPGSIENQELDEEIQNLLHFESFLLGSNLSSSDSGLDEGDVFQCGKCKKQFTTFSTFLTHKKGRCQAVLVKEEESGDPQLNNTYSFPGVKAETSYEANRPVIFSESDGIISFTVQPESLNVPSTAQPLRIFTGNDENQYVESSLAISGLKTLHIVEAENSSQTSTISGSYLLSTGGKISEPHIILDENTNETVTLSLLEDESPLESEQTKHTIKELEYKMKCSFCGKLFRKKFDLQQHLRSHTKERPFQCIVCGRAFSQKSNVMKHMTTHKVWPTKLLTLPKNPIQKSSENGSNPGNKVTDADGNIMVMENSFVCQYCPCTFSSFRELKSHRKTHSSQKVYKCIQKDCSATFEDLDSFLEHIQSHTNEVQYKCHMCHSEFNSLHDLAVHQNFHETNNKSSTKTLTCRKCKGKFSSMESLEQHLATDSHWYPCVVCQKVFTCERFLRRHLLTHSSATNFLCSVCHKSFRTEQYLNIHKTIHSSLKPYSCKLCSAKFNRKDKLSRHNLIHENAKRYKCPFNKKLGCGKEFNRKDKLKEHILTHDSTSKNVCRVCNENGIKKNGLVKDEGSCFSGGKPCKLHAKLSEKQAKNSNSPESVTADKVKTKVTKHKTPKDDVPTIEIVVMPMLGSSDQPGEATFGVMFPSDGPVDLSQPMGTLPYQEVPIYTIKPLK